MKKSKIIVPALAVLLLSTAASVTGTVAWFTANRVFNMKAGEFAVVNTKNNLEAVVTPGFGTDLSGTKDIVVEEETAGVIKKLTDASFNHNAAEPYFVEPDEFGTGIGDKFNLSDGSLSSKLGRESGIYTAFTWDITFKMSFSTNANKKVGIFLDLGSANTWAHKSVKFETGHVITEDEQGTYFANPDLTGSTQAFAKDHAVTAGEAENTYYIGAPIDTGKGFRIAFVPTSIPEDCFGYAKVWAPHQSSANAKYINDVEPAEYANPGTYAINDIVYRTVEAKKHYYVCKTAASNEDFDPAKWTEITELKAKEVAYNKTSSYTTDTGTPTRTADVTSALPVMAYGDTTRAPESAIASSACLSGKTNYLGYFYPVGGVVEMTYTCIAWYEGTDPEIINTASTTYETMTTSLEFVASQLSD